MCVKRAAIFLYYSQKGDNVFETECSFIVESKY